MSPPAGSQWRRLRFVSELRYDQEAGVTNTPNLREKPSDFEAPQSYPNFSFVPYDSKAP